MSGAWTKVPCINARGSLGRYIDANRGMLQWLFNQGAMDSEPLCMSKHEGWLSRVPFVQPDHQPMTKMAIRGITKV
jgi:hypothetical protein